jgi:hypothetical protein
MPSAMRLARRDAAIVARNGRLRKRRDLAAISSS